jgi:hypothetical protein
MGNFSATPGMTTVNISGTVKNARLVEYPEDETFHMYYLVYEVLSGTDTAAGSSEADREVLVGAMVGEPKNVSLAESGNLNIDFVLEQKQTYHIKIYYKTKENLDSGTPFSDQIDAKVFTKTYTLNNASITRTAQKGTFYENGAISTNDSFNMAKHIEDQINNNSAVFVPIPGIDANGIYVTTRDGITISSTAIDLNTSTTPAEGAQTQGTTIANGRTLKFTTSIASEIVESEQPSLRIFYRLERIAQNDYTDPSRTKDGSDTNKWETVIADSREPEEVLKALTWSNNDEYSGREADAGTGSSSFNQAHFWQYYDDEPDTNGQDLSYAPNPDAISSINTMQMPYYTGGLITPGYYYRVTTRIYQKVGDTYTNVTVSTDGNNQEDPHAESTPELWSAWSTAAGSSKLKTVLSYAESDAITITFGLYDVNDTSVDGKYFVRLAKLEGDEWKVVDATTSKVKIENAGMSYDQAFYMNQSYTKVKFTGLDASSTYRLQFYAAFDTDYDNHIDATEMSASAVSDSYLTGNLTSDILTLDTYYPRQKSSELKAPVSTLGETNGAYEDAFKNKNPYGNSGQLTFAQSSLLAGISGETETMSDDLQAYAGSYTNMYTIKGSNTIWLNYLGAFNTDEIDKISYDVALTTTTGSVQYVSHEIYANDTQDTYGSFSFSNTNGKVTLKLTLNTESEIADEGVASAPLNWMSNKGEYTIILRFYSAKRDADNKIVTDQSSGDPIYVLMKKDGDLDPVFTVQ